MNKKIKIVGGISLAVAAAFVANNVIVDNVAKTFASEFESRLYSANNKFIDIQLIESSIESGQVLQQYAMYITINGRREGTPFYFSNIAQVSPFGLAVDGELSIPKDKGLTSSPC